MISTLSDLVKRTVRKAMEETRVAMPARILSYNAGSRLARIQILQPELTDDGKTVAQPVITDVPVFMPIGGGAAVTFPVASGDEGVVWFADQDIGAWSADGNRSPDSARRHSLTDAMFMPSQGRGPADADNMVISFGGATITIDPGGGVTIDAPGDVTINGNLTVNGSISGNGDSSFGGGSLTHNGTDIGDTHRHGGVESGGSNTDEPI